MQVQGHTKIDLECGLCLEAFVGALHFEFVELYTFPTHVKDDTELVLPDDFQGDLTPLVREYVQLEVPISAVCREGCQGLCPVCGENLNYTTCDHSDEVADPRLEVLRSLLDDDTEA